MNKIFKEYIILNDTNIFSNNNTVVLAWKILFRIYYISKRGKK